jgi:hypothetical protein
MSRLGWLLIVFGVLVVGCGIVFGPGPVDQLAFAQASGCLAVIAGVALIVWRRARDVRARRAYKADFERRLGAGWRPCPQCHGEGVIRWQTFVPAPRGGFNRYHERPCETCAGHGWFTPLAPGTPPQMP